MSESNYTNTSRKKVKEAKEASKAQKLASKLALVVAAIGVSIALWLLLKGETREVVEIEVPYPYGEPNSLTDMTRFRQAYLEANYPAETTVGIRSVVVTGQIESDGGTTDFSLIKQRPDYFRITLEHGAFEMTVGVIEEQVWQRVLIPLQDEQISLVEGPQATMWRRQSAFFDRVISAFEGDGEIESIAVATKDGKEYLNLEISGTELIPSVNVWIDPQTLHIALQEEAAADGTIKTSAFSDYRRIRSIAVPHDITNMVAGEILNRTIIESATFNNGVVLSVFQMPES